MFDDGGEDISQQQLIRMRDELGFDKSVSLEQKVCSSVRDVLDNYDYLSRTVARKGYSDISLPAPKEYVDARFFSQPHNNPAHENVVYTFIDSLFVDDFSLHSTDKGKFFSLQLKGISGLSLDACMPYNHAFDIDPEVLDALYNDSHQQYWAYGKALNKDFAVSRDGFITAREEMFNIHYLQLDVDDGDDEVFSPVFSPDLTLAQ